MPTPPPRYRSGETPAPGDLIRGPQELGDRELVAIVVQVLDCPGNDLGAVPIGWVEPLCNEGTGAVGEVVDLKPRPERVHLTRENRKELMQSARCELLHRWRGDVQVILEVFQTVR